MLLPAGAATSAPRTGPAGDAFYTPPTPLPGSGHGDLIWRRSLSGAAAVPGAAREHRILYRSTGIDGRAVAVSGTLSIPRGRPPKGGWPVVTYAHGTTGIADVCAPSRVTAGGPAQLYVIYVNPLLTRWLRAGFAVVRTDYEGLGTPGEHPYLVGTSEGRSTLDAVRAARDVDRRLGRRVIIAGHSQGGHAALFAAALARSWTPDLRVRGTVAFAPATHLHEQIPVARVITSPGGGLSALIGLILRGIDLSRPQVGVPQLLGPRAQELYPRTTSECVPQLAEQDSWGGLAPREILRDDADVSGIYQALSDNGPERLNIRTRVLVEQGASDATVIRTYTDKLVQKYEERGTPVEYNLRDGVDHARIVIVAAAPATRWMRARLRRR